MYVNVYEIIRFFCRTDTEQHMLSKKLQTILLIRLKPYAIFETHVETLNRMYNLILLA